MLLIGYKRTENIAKRLCELSVNVDVPLVISIDGGLNLEERQEILCAVEIYEESNQRSIEKLIFRPINLGLARHIQIAISEILNSFEFCIVIEDDISVSRNFIFNLRKASPLFERKDILTIGGFSPFVPYFNFRPTKNRFRETRYFSAWGWMISKEKWKQYEPQLHLNDLTPKLSSSPAWDVLNRTQKKIWLRRFKKVSIENPSTWDFQMQYLAMKNGWLNILPVYKICENLGFDDSRGTHTIGRRPKWMKEQGKFPTETFNLEELVRINTLLGKILNFVDSVFIAGDSRIIKTGNSIKRARQILVRKYK